VLTDAVALIVPDIDGAEVVALPNEVDGTLKAVAVLTLGLGIDSEVEDTPERPVLTLLEGWLRDVDGRVMPVLREELGKLRELLGTLTDICVLNVVLGTLIDVLGKDAPVLIEVDGRVSEGDGKTTDVLGKDSPVFTEVDGRLIEVVGTVKEVVGAVNEGAVLTVIVERLIEVEGTATDANGSEVDVPVFTDVDGRLTDVLGNDTVRPVLMLGDGVLTEIPVLTLVKETLVDGRVNPVLRLAVVGRFDETYN
jgi:hypothetical protein